MGASQYMGKSLEFIQAHKKYSMNQKIPTFVKEFTRQEITNKQFTAKHSSILRILTKWCKNLQDIFEDSEQHIRQKPYPFKNINNELVTIFNNRDGKQKLIEQMAQEYTQAK